MATLQLEWINQLAGVSLPLDPVSLKTGDVEEQVDPQVLEAAAAYVAGEEIEEGLLQRAKDYLKKRAKVQGFAKKKEAEEAQHFKLGGGGGHNWNQGSSFARSEAVESVQEDQLAALAGLIEHLQAEGYEIPEDMTVLELVQEICDNPDLTEEVEWLAEHGLVEYEEETAPSLADGPMISPVAQLVMSEWFTRVSGNELTEDAMGMGTGHRGKVSLTSPDSSPKRAKPGSVLRGFTKPSAKPEPTAAKPAEDVAKAKAAQRAKDNADIEAQEREHAAAKTAKETANQSRMQTVYSGPDKPAKPSAVIPSQGADRKDKFRASSGTSGAAPTHTAPSSPALGAKAPRGAVTPQAPRASTLTPEQLKALGPSKKKSWLKSAAGAVGSGLKKAGKALKAYSKEESYLQFADGVSALTLLLETEGYELPDDLTAQALFVSIAQTPELAPIAAEPNYRQLVELGSSLVESEGITGPLSAIPVLALVSDSAADTLQTISVADLLAAWGTNPIQEGIELSEEDTAFVAQMETLDDLMTHLQTEGYELPADLTLEGLFTAVSETPELAWLLEDADYLQLFEGIGGALKHVGGVAAAVGAAGAGFLGAATAPIVGAGLGAYALGHLIHKAGKKLKKYSKKKKKRKEASGEADLERSAEQARLAHAHNKVIAHHHAARAEALKKAAEHDAEIERLSPTPVHHRMGGHGIGVVPGHTGSGVYGNP